jgi:ABC-type multidrug transport system permease subunit
VASPTFRQTLLSGVEQAHVVESRRRRSNFRPGKTHAVSFYDVVVGAAFVGFFIAAMLYVYGLRRYNQDEKRRNPR